MENSLTTIDISDKETVKTLRETVAYGLNDSEFKLFGEFCRATGLNPFKKEIWAIKAGGRLQLMTGITGYVSIANRHPQYDGMEEGLIGPDGQYLPMTYPGNDFIGAWVKVYRKDRRIPSEGVVMLEEYDKGQGNWKTMRRVMIGKCAQSVGLRKAFPQELNGTYTAEEMPVDYSRNEPIKVEHVELKVPYHTGEIKITPVNEVTEKRLPDPFAAGKREIDFSKLPWRYHLPVKKAGKDMEAVRAWMKDKGFKFNEEDKHWYGPFEVAKMAEYYRPLESSGLQPQQKPASDIPFVLSEGEEFHDDMLPPNF